MGISAVRKVSARPSSITDKRPGTKSTNRLVDKYGPASKRLPEFSGLIAPTYWKDLPVAKKATKKAKAQIAEHGMRVLLRRMRYIIRKKAIKDLIKAKGGGRLGFSSHRITEIVTRVKPGSGAAKAGIKRGDVFLSVNGVPIKSALYNCHFCKIENGKLHVYSYGERAMSWQGPKESRLVQITKIPKSGISTTKVRITANDLANTFQVTLKKLKPTEHCFHDLVFGPVGSKATVTISRNGKKMSLKVVRGK